MTPTGSTTDPATGAATDAPAQTQKPGDRDKTIYVREDHAIAYAAARTGKHADRVATYLSATRQVIICGYEALTIASTQP